MIVCLGPTPAVQRTMIFASIRTNAVNRAISVLQYAAGKSIAASRVLKTLGTDSLATGFVGGDSGRFICQELDQAGIAHDFVEVHPPTRLCITLIDQSANTATELVEDAPALRDTDYEIMLEKLEQQLNRAKLLLLSGSLPPGAKNDFYARCAKLAGSRVPVIIDAVGQPLLNALDCRPLVVKHNQTELACTLGMEIDSDQALKDAMRQLVCRGARWAIVTRGSASTLVTDGQSFWQISSPPVKAISAIGSGDAFSAGLATGIVHGKDVPQACILAVACAAANAMTPHVGYVRREDVNDLMTRIGLLV